MLGEFISMTLSFLSEGRKTEPIELRHFTLAEKLKSTQVFLHLNIVAVEDTGLKLIKFCMVFMILLFHLICLYVSILLLTRGNNYKLVKNFSRYDIRQHFFTQINTWNSLPMHVVTSSSVNSFKNDLDKFWSNQEEEEEEELY